jgi:hypothetical protein
LDRETQYLTGDVENDIALDEKYRRTYNPIPGSCGRNRRKALYGAFKKK